MEEMIAAAIAASLEDTTDLAAVEQLETKFEERVPGGHGTIVQVNLINQFSSAFNDIIAKHETPQSICGYLSVAYAVILARCFGGSGGGGGGGG
eukprot:CAMPEP_0205923430 /NCGR_PEP_ID=MMETSP1325-20131115/16197_1 /ASSEMBLY_ACC=CAM_ASM_000708 /TAXON_ID=236786 /ORGANISM="Florenciella sp., Strain RCC1007" /LENGTH=93 /DNA_ID=CAMNT_0053291647 /DNA_START=73 /DNA_END=351 /DNA_ORIENTATION=-